MFYLNLKVTTREILLLPQGSIKSILAYLGTHNTDTNRLDSFLVRLFGKPQSGWIDFGGEMISKADLFYRLTHSKAALKEIKLIPGESMYFFVEQISEVFGGEQKEEWKKQLWELYNQKAICEEGMIIPQTYKLPYGATPQEIMGYLLDYSSKSYDKLAQSYGINPNSKKWQEILSKASIIQKESANLEEMPIISAVIDNRLKLGMPLQMDGSLNYGKYAHIKITPQRIREDNSPYNTYKNKGLPPCPSGSISNEAIKASLAPADVPYLYFVRNKNGVHSFSTNYQEHQENFKK